MNIDPANIKASVGCPFDRLTNRGRYVLVAKYRDHGDFVETFGDDLEAIQNAARIVMRREHITALRRMVSWDESPIMAEWNERARDFWNSMVSSTSFSVYEWDDFTQTYVERWNPDTVDEFNAGWIPHEDYLYYLQNPDELTPDDEDG